MTKAIDWDKAVERHRKTGQKKLKSVSKEKIWMCDFETLAGENLKRTYVWGWACKGIMEEEELTGSTLDEYMSWVHTTSKRNRGTQIYFHNLSFDGKFMLDWLFRNGFRYSDTPGDMTFNILASPTTLYSINIYWSYNSPKKFIRTKVLDSFKKLPFKVERIAKAWKLPMLKGEIDYKKHRDEGHEMDDEERAYILDDVRIVAAAMKSLLNGGFTRMTIGSDALQVFTDMMGDPIIKKHMPVLDWDVDSYIRAAYRGGFTYVNPKFQGKNIKRGCVFDVNSLYPSRMYSCLMPWGKPKKFVGQYEYDPFYPLYVSRVLVSFDLKKNHIPTVQLKKSRFFNGTEYATTTDRELVELTLSSVDLKLLFDHYHIHAIEYIDGYKFQHVDILFRKYIDRFMKIKIESKGAKREEAKLFLNNLYGKLGSNPNKRGKIPFFDEEKDLVRYEEAPPALGDGIYIPMAVFITAYARDLTIRSAQAVFKRFIYADTDSLHLEGWEKPTNIEIHPDKLGAWKHELDFEYGRFLRPKTYIEGVKSSGVKVDLSKLKVKEVVLPSKARAGVMYKLKVTVAGMQARQHSQVTWKNFKRGAIYTGKLKPKTIPGGVVLEDTTFEIN